ncbi:VCBS repeat-containing protein [Geobacter sp. AOG1]|uniref:FG-GAP repeat domain-containing protein n=1 Tax=Geobacter sp. AOG1 TaxID=1566346 RepID=UPI001CC5EB2A|nr:VCBS repeat-containing protein [Geobacter sp. AOG1]GFE57215.1 hypothetical protein AOG1_10950 [Geobacter sp. AOG1]
MRKIAACLILLLSFVYVTVGEAAVIKAYVSEFSVTGGQNKDELKGILQTLLTTRLASDAVTTLDNKTGAEVIVSGSYLQIGKVFSIDAVARNGRGDVVTRSFVQGESQDELIAAIGKLAQVLAEGIAKNYGLTASSQPAATAAGVATVPVVAPPADIVRPAEIQKPSPAATSADTATTSEIIRPTPVVKSAGGGWVSQRLTGVMSGIALGRTLDNGEREVFIAGNRTLKYYRMGEGLKLIAEVGTSGDEKILGVDTADLDGDGVQEVYLTVLSGETLVSRVYLADGTGLKKIAENLPYFMRGMALAGGKKKIYVQQMSTDADFYGDVYELVKSGDRYEMKNPLKLPRFAFLYNFNQFKDREGKTDFVVLHPDGYLLVYSAARDELWRSNDKYGGSELYFQRPDMSNFRTTGDTMRWIFLQQRIVVTGDGEIVVPQNGGFWVIGNSRSYGKSAVVAFAWDGSSLEERWRTRQGQNYLADYAFDEARKELVLMEVVKKEGLLDKGASALYIKKVE